MKDGICRSCKRYFSLDEASELMDNLWECPYCRYPNSEDELRFD